MVFRKDSHTKITGHTLRVTPAGPSGRVFQQISGHTLGKLRVTGLGGVSEAQGLLEKDSRKK